MRAVVVPLKIVCAAHVGFSPAGARASRPRAAEEHRRPHHQRRALWRQVLGARSSVPPSSSREHAHLRLWKRDEVLTADRTEAMKWLVPAGAHAGRKEENVHLARPRGQPPTVRQVEGRSARRLGRRRHVPEHAGPPEYFRASRLPRVHWRAVV